MGFFRKIIILSLIGLLLLNIKDAIFGVGAMIVGAMIVGAIIVGAMIVGAMIVGTMIVGAMIVGANIVEGMRRPRRPSSVKYSGRIAFRVTISEGNFIHSTCETGFQTIYNKYYFSECEAILLETVFRNRFQNKMIVFRDENPRQFL